jgi:hypothetical protein
LTFSCCWGVPVRALQAKHGVQRNPLPDLGIAPQVDDDARHFAEVAKKFGEASMSDNGLTAGEQARCSPSVNSAMK